MKHFFYIDPIEKLNTKKDSSIFIAQTLKESGEEVYILFDENFYVTNFHQTLSFQVFEFTANIGEDFYLNKFKITNQKIVLCEKGDFVHFRLDPPVSESYLKSAWLLLFLENHYGINVINSPEGILLHNEKLLAYEDENALESCIGSSINAFETFAEGLKELGVKSCIFKPMNSFSGLGIHKIDLDGKFLKNTEKILSENQGAMIMQPFIEQVITEGEIRTIFWIGDEIGTIRKMPPAGSFLSNIAQGAKFHSEKLDPFIKKKCENICWKLKEQGILLVAFDILMGKISEVNVTCPGLMVEVSNALNENIAKKMLPNLSA